MNANGGGNNIYLTQNAAAYPGYIADKSATLDPSAQFMKKALDTALKGDIVRDIYPTLNYFRTEEKQSKYKDKFTSFIHFVCHWL